MALTRDGKDARKSRPALRACSKNPAKRRVRARGVQETMRFRHLCRPGPLTGRFSKHALRIAVCLLPLLLAGESAFAAEGSFRNDVMAVLAKSGCSAGTCHGNKNGKGGYKLSLRGQEPELDYGTLTRESFGRRTNPLEPEQSLVLLKATAEVPHEGGLRLKKGSAEYDILRRWIAEGMPNDLASAPKLRRLEVTPTEKVLLEPVRELQLRARAIFADGAVRDVTTLAVYEPANGLAKGSAGGLVQGQGAGEAPVRGRYLHCQEPARLAFVPARPRFQWRQPPAQSSIDEQIFAKLR